jgi:hypothetical protein
MYFYCIVTCFGNGAVIFKVVNARKEISGAWFCGETDTYLHITTLQTTIFNC